MENDDTRNTLSGEEQSAGENQEPEAEPELSHSDKLIGIFTEPAKTYERIAQFPPKTIDWFLPVIILLVLVIISQFLMLSNKQIYYQMQQKQMARIEKSFNDMVAKGQMTKEQAQQRLNEVQDRMGKGISTVQMIIMPVSILIFGFIVFFIMCGIYYLFVRFVLKGEGTYASVLVASGLTSYIGMIQIVLAAIFALILGRALGDTSLAAFLGTERTTFLGFVFSKIDIFSIWIYIVLSIGLAKMFKSATTGKYYIVVFGIWLIGGLIIYFITSAIPFLRFFGV